MYTSQAGGASTGAEVLSVQILWTIHPKGFCEGEVVTDQELQRKLNHFVKLGNELVQEARRRYGRNGNLFHEAEGRVYIMEGDCDGNASERQERIRHSAKVNADWGSGAW